MKGVLIFCYKEGFIRGGSENVKNKNNKKAVEKFVKTIKSSLTFKIVISKKLC